MAALAFVLGAAACSQTPPPINGDAGACSSSNPEGNLPPAEVFCEAIDVCFQGQSHCQQVVCQACTWADGELLAAINCSALNGSCTEPTLVCLASAEPANLTQSCAAALAPLFQKPGDGG